jgi:hypothetical protein
MTGHTGGLVHAFINCTVPRLHIYEYESSENKSSLFLFFTVDMAF